MYEPEEFAELIEPRRRVIRAALVDYAGRHPGSPDGRLAARLADRYAPVDYAAYRGAVERLASIAESDAENCTSTYEELEGLAGRALAMEDAETIEDLASREDDEDDEDELPI